MRKRQKFVLTAAILTLGMWIFRLTPLEWQYGFAGLMTIVTILMGLWSLREGLNGLEWLMLPILPGLFTAGFLLFSILVPATWLLDLLSFLPVFIYQLLPQMLFRWLGSGLLLLAFGIGHYVLLLTSNIYSVAAIRTIALFRTAQAMGFVMTLATGFFLFNTILSFRSYFWLVGLLVSGISFLLLMPGFWSVNLESKLTKSVWLYSLILAFMMGFFSLSISFWPISVAVSSLFLCVMLYVYLGITQHHLSQRLFGKTVWEYVTVGVVVLVTMLLTSGWGV